MKIEEVKSKVLSALKKFYREDKFLLQHDLGERCLVHRLAVCLEAQNFKGYYIDCEYNKAHLNKNESHTKKVSSSHGNYIDIIITKRDGDYRNDLVCFEIKKSKNYSERGNDRKKLRILTGGRKFGYAFGFYILLGRRLSEVNLELYMAGERVEEANSNL